ncbi:MAG: hypothetical protein ACFE75_11015 [Candidatus Hodarchaeota archaeon]
MQKNKKIIGFCIVYFLVIGITLMSISSSVFAANYDIGLTKGTDILIVNQYNETAWKSTVNTSSTPNNWFEGEADELGAQSKITIRGWNFITWETYDVFVSFFLPAFFESQEITPLLISMSTQGYNETTINTNYTNSYNLWIGLSNVWNFTVGNFEEDPSIANEPLLIFQNPMDIDDVLNDYNNLSADLNSNPAIQFSGYSFPILDPDEFLWLFIFNGLSLGTPYASYLEDFINGLNCSNARVENNVLIINRTGETNYTVEISYGPEGIMSSFLVKNVGDTIIYQIITTNSDWIFFITIIILVICIGGLSTYLIIRKRKINILRHK